MNIVPVVAAERAGGHITCKVEGGGTIRVPLESADAAEPAHLGIRPEHIVIVERDGPAEATLSGRAISVEQLGDAHLVHVAPQGGPVLTVRGQGEAPVRRGDEVALNVPGEACHLFARDGTAIR